ncbi:MAG: formate--tetrahydrofolate ligase [Candidatus Methanomethylophilaceae archaeon]|nr:formate--tetrahydrofolate ligase [Candidatus Methanomethylophilaceae archaeon]HIJ00618.1 formate--tetrahydrofolate ligase [Candidatus Methanomethylophilaceae archaeon]
MTAPHNTPTPGLRDITELAASLGLEKDSLILYGKDMAKVPLNVLKQHRGKNRGKLIVTTAITATPAGEGKTVTTIGLVQGLGHLGIKAIGTLREPSLGPIFGIKGGATGGGRAQVHPVTDINLHFTGDIHAVGAAHNLLSAILENHIAKGNDLDIDPTQILLGKAMDIGSRELRHIVIGLGGKSKGGVPHESSFMITPASEISAILALAEDYDDLRQRLEKMTVAYNNVGDPISASQLGCVGAMMALLKDAIHPNLVQTLEGQPMFVHGFPFANIAHGTNSVIAIKAALELADYVVTETGFAADLGAEKFFDIVCRQSGLVPDCAVLVASVRALKMHGGAELGNCNDPNHDALIRGFTNLDRHITNIRLFGLPVVVAVNRFESDSEEELAEVIKHCQEQGVEAEVCTVFSEGGVGGEALAKKVLSTIAANHNRFRMLYNSQDSIKEKIEIIAKKVYGADQVIFLPAAERSIDAAERQGLGHLPVCMAKTQASLSDDPRLRGVPTGWKLTVRELLISSGAGFLVPICGGMNLMPGLPKRPSALDIDLDEHGQVIGLH